MEKWLWPLSRLDDLPGDPKGCDGVQLEAEASDLSAEPTIYRYAFELVNGPGGAINAAWGEIQSDPECH